MNGLNFKLPVLSFDHPVADLIIDLEKLREPNLPHGKIKNTFMVLKKIFHVLESVGSARIEGNNTTIADYILESDDPEKSKHEDLMEISNIESILDEIDEFGDDLHIHHNFIKNIHSRLVGGLSREGSKAPGAYRSFDVKISKSSHVPPSHVDVFMLMDNLIDFINEPHSEKYDLLKIAIIHHAFVWIHPFDNGNGRVVRLLTYAVLIKYGYQIDSKGRILNPTAVFCSNREAYYQNLMIADRLDNDSILEWCRYVLSGIKIEFEKLKLLADQEYLTNNVLIPATVELLSRGIVNLDELAILKIGVANEEFKKADVVSAVGKSTAQVSRILAALKEKNLISTISERKYSINYFNKNFISVIASRLKSQGLLPENI